MAELEGKTGEELEKALLQEQTERTELTELPEDKQYTPEDIDVDEDTELLDPETVGQMGDIETTPMADVLDVTDYDQEPPDTAGAPQVDPTQIGDVEDMSGISGELSEKSIMDAAQGQLSPESIAIAETEELDPRATTQYQLAELFKTVQEGGSTSSVGCTCCSQSNSHYAAARSG